MISPCPLNVAFSQCFSSRGIERTGRDWPSPSTGSSSFARRSNGAPVPEPRRSNSAGSALIGHAWEGRGTIRVAGSGSWICVPPPPSPDMTKLPAMCWPNNAILAVCVPSLTVKVPRVLLLLAA